MRTTIFLFLISSLSLSAQSGTVEAVDGLIIGGTQLSTHPDGTIIHDGTEFLLKSGGSWTSLYRKPKVTVTTQNNNNTAYNFHFDDGWVPIGVAHTIVKDYDDSIIELELDSRMTCSAINNGFGIQFELRIDGISPDGASLGSLRVQNLTQASIQYKCMLDAQTLDRMLKM